MRDDTPDPLRHLLAAWDEADALAELETLTLPADNHRRRTREERDAERAARADWDADTAGAGSLLRSPA